MNELPYTPAQAKALVRAERIRKELWYYDDQRKCRVNYTQESKEARDAAILKVFNGGKETKKFRFMDLPFEIRAMILEELLVRPVGIAPGGVYHEVKTGKNERNGVYIYSYQWATHPNAGDNEDLLPKYDGSSQRLLIRELSNPTKIELDPDEISGEYDPVTDSFISKFLVGRESEWPMICSTREIVTTGLQPNILRTCKKLYEQGQSALYHDNLFVFYSELHEPDAFDGLLDWLKNKKVDPTATMDTIFSQKAQSESLIAFLSEVGRDNSKLLDKIQIDGMFFVSHPSRKRLDLSDMLPVHAAIMNKLCPHLRTLIIHQLFVVSKDIDVKDDTIAKVVEALPSLQTLQLGSGFGWSDLEPIRTSNWNWGQARRWERIVDDRWRQNMSSKAEDTENYNKV